VYNFAVGAKAAKFARIFNQSMASLRGKPTAFPRPAGGQLLIN